MADSDWRGMERPGGEWQTRNGADWLGLAWSGGARNITHGVTNGG